MVCLCTLGTEMDNGEQITQIINHAKANLQKWAEAEASAWHPDFGTVAGAAQTAAWAHTNKCISELDKDSSRRKAWNDVLREVREASSGGFGLERGKALGAALGACTALIVWDNCADILSLPPEVVKARAVTGDHAAVLLYPAVLAMYEGD